MRVAVIGDGGREAAIAWACRRSGHVVTQIAASDVDVVFALGDEPFDLVIPGPEAVIVDGVADRCERAGIACFAPLSDLARLESSKGWARDLATSLGVPGPRYARFDAGDHRAAEAWWQALGAEVVVKLDGLAGGKGVVVADTDTGIAAAIRDTEGAFVLEERLRGPEVSLIALCDGMVARALPLAQDHKRIGDADTGPNTGGMGAIAPVPLALDTDVLVATFIQPIIDHFARLGTPYRGALYAGLMLTSSGPRLIEYNVRFGDPETQALLPLLSADLAELALAATRGELADHRLGSIAAAACTVVAAAPGYPQAPVLGAEVHYPADLLEGRSESSENLIGAAVLFPAGMSDGRVSGGRVLAVTGIGTDLAHARAVAYGALDSVSSPGLQIRRDIGWRAPGLALSSYAAAGVDIDEGARSVDLMRAAVERTHGPEVIAGVGSFGGVFSAASLRNMRDPVLVASTDGVGTKVELAARARHFAGIGADLVNHCINDVLVQGARPLFFLDYVAAARLDAAIVAEVVASMASACADARCALLGGETAEMPGVYHDGALDIAGTLVGVVERDRLLPRPGIAVDDVLIGLVSSGLHTNGFSLVRALIDWLPLDSRPAGFPAPLAETLLAPHRSYLDVISPLLDTAPELVKALVHITGGGLVDNLPRVLPEGCGAEVDLGSWPLDPLFSFLMDLAHGLELVELYRTLNMGIGMVVIAAPDTVDQVRAAIAEPTWVIGRVVAGSAVTLCGTPVRH